MKNGYVGLIYLVITMWVFVMIFGHLYISCSTVENNICNIPYEPSGMQMFYFFMALPIWFLTSAAKYIIAPLKFALFPIVYGVFYSGVLLSLDHYNLLGGDIFYIITLNTSFIFLIIEIVLLTKLFKCPNQVPL